MLIKCPECGKEVSDNAVACVHCGYPLTQKKEAVQKTDQAKRKDGPLVASNIVLGVFGFMMLCGVLTSNGGVEGNRNAAMVSWFLAVGSICALLAIKKLNKIFAIASTILLLVAFIVSYKSIKISPAYLLLELAIGINALSTIWHLKKNKVF